MARCKSEKGIMNTVMMMLMKNVWPRLVLKGPQVGVMVLVKKYMRACSFYKGMGTQKA